MEPLVSIIVPIYNAEAHLDECVASAVSQTYKKIEIILVDDGSKDNSVLICKKWAALDPRVRVFEKENAGVSSARNFALKQFEGDYVLFLDADDYLMPNSVEKMIEAVNAYGDSIVFGAFNIFNGVNNVISSAYTANEIDVILALKQCFQKGNTWAPTVWAKLFSKNILSIDGHIKMFDESLLQGEDYVWLVEILCNLGHGKITCIADPLYNYRRFSEDPSLSNFKNSNYFDRKTALLHADKYVISKIERLCDAQLEGLAIERYCNEYVNGEVIIALMYGYRTMLSFRKRFYDAFSMFLSNHQINIKVKVKKLAIHVFIGLPWPKKLLEYLVERAEKKREERLYL